VVREQPVHLAHDRHAYLLPSPLLALHQRALAVASQDQVDATVRAAQSGFFDCIALAPEGFADKKLEVAPARRGQAFQPGSGIQQLASLIGASQGKQGGKHADRQPGPGKYRLGKNLKEDVASGGSDRLAPRR